MATFLHAAIFLLASCTLRARAAIETLDDKGSRLEWTPATILSSSDCRGRPDNDLCTGSWWTEDSDSFSNLTSRLTWGPDTSVGFSFRGSAFTVYGSTLTSGASASVQVDQDPLFSFSTTPAQGDEEKTQVELYSRSGLDPSVVHDVLISYDNVNNGQTASDNRRWLIIDYILINEVAESTVTTPTSDPTSSSPASTQTSDGSGGLGTAASAGIGVGVGVLVAVILLLLLLLRRRRQRQRIDLDAPPMAYATPTLSSGTASMSQAQWTAPSPWQPESMAPSTVPPTVASDIAPREDAGTMPPAYTAVGRRKN